MEFSYIRIKETMIMVLRIGQTYPFCHHILGKEYYTRKKLLTNALNTLIWTKLKNLFRSFLEGLLERLLEGRTKVWGDYVKNLESSISEYSSGEKTELLFGASGKMGLTVLMIGSKN